MLNIIGVALAHEADETNNWQSMMGGGNMMSYMWGLGGGWGWTSMIFMWVFWILLLVALILLIIYLLKQIQK